MMERLVIRCDGNAQIGYGHVIRCCALTNMVTPQTIHFFSSDPIISTLRYHCENTFDFTKLEEETLFFDNLKTHDIVVIDGYQFDTFYQSQIKRKGCKLIVIDDLFQHKMVADAVINPTAEISADHYTGALSTRYCLGLSFVLLRKAFLTLSTQWDLKKRTDELFICFGGSDPLNKTRQVVDSALKSGRFSHIHIVIGEGYKWKDALEFFVKEHTNVSSYCNLNEQSLAKLMSEIPYAVVPSSTVLIEALAARMIPISSYYTNNQRIVYQNHLLAGNIIDAGDFSDEQLMLAFRKLQNTPLPRTIIDGYSGERVQKLLESLYRETKATIRPVTVDDTDLTYQWANSSIIRRFSFNKNFISYSDHQNWLYSKITSPSCVYLIFEYDSKTTGSIRFDLNNSTATISYLLNPDFHGKGLGTLLLKAGLNYFQNCNSAHRISVVQGFVMPENTASKKLFQSFGFTEHVVEKGLLYKKLIHHVEN